MTSGGWRTRQEGHPEPVRVPSNFADSLWIPSGQEGIDDSSCPAWSLAAAGDFCPSLGIKRRNVSSPLLRGTLESSAIRIANLEGAVTDSGARIVKSGIHLKLDPDAVTKARLAGFNLVTLANNHVLDFGEEGLTDTLAAVSREGLASCGAGRNSEEAFRPAEILVQGVVPVTVFGVCGNYFGVAERARPGFAWIGAPELDAAIREASESGRVVVVCSHGGIEHVPLPPPPLQQRYRQLVDAGAALVLGSHPHVPQGFEQYRGALIFYSLGNFLFDSLTGEATTKGDVSLLVRAEFQGRKLLGCHVLPLEQRDDTAHLLTENAERDPKAVFDYLLLLEQIMASEDRLLGCWQEMAIWLLFDKYLQPLTRVACLAEGAPTEGRVGQAGRIMKELVYLWTPEGMRRWARSVRRRVRRLRARPIGESGESLLCLAVSERLTQSVAAAVLRTLCSLRVETDRWCIESALSVLSGEAKDYRNRSADETLRFLLSVTNSRINPAYVPFMRRKTREK